MPKIAKQLSDLAARKARPRDVAYTLASGNGLFLVVLPTGGKQWRVRFQTPEGKRGNRVIGIYPDMGVADAHKATEALRQQVPHGWTGLKACTIISEPLRRLKMRSRSLHSRLWKRLGGCRA